MDFVWENLGELIPEEETFTHSHLSWSSMASTVSGINNTVMVMPKSFQNYRKPTTLQGHVQFPNFKHSKVFRTTIKELIGNIISSTSNKIWSKDNRKK